MRDSFFKDTLTRFDIQEIVKNGGKVIEIYESVIYRENFKLSSIRKFLEKVLDKLLRLDKNKKMNVMI